MKKTFIGLFLAILAFTGQSQGLNKVIVEKYYVSDATDFTKSGGTLPVGSVTWRIYVDMAPGYLFQQADGDKFHSLVLSTSTSFYNSDLGDNNPNGIATANAKTGTVMLDSWLSTGAASKSYWGIVKSQDDGVGTLVNSDGALKNNDPTAGIPLTVQDGLLLGGSNGVPTIPSFSTLGIPDSVLAVLGDGTVTGSSFTLTNGAWYILGGVSGPAPANRVLIAQITTDGIFHYALNLQLGKKIDQSQSLTERYVSANPQSGEKSDAKYNLTGTLSPDVSLLASTITAPTEGAHYNAGDVVSIAADATYTYGSITKVEFFVNGSKVGESATAPYTYNWTSVGGAASLTAVATTNLGENKTSTAVNISVAGILPPTVSITSPADGSSAQLGDSLAITATAFADAGNSISSVEFFVDNVSIGMDNTAPYSIKYLGTTGLHKLVARATDNRAMTTASDTVSVTFLSHIPSVNITAPAGGSTYLVGATVDITATASDNAGSIASVEFFVDGVSIGTDNSAPYTASYVATLGSHTITAKATNNASEFATSDVSISVANNLPSVSITAPADGSSTVVGDSLVITANASDIDGTIASVEFFVDGTSVGMANVSPFTVKYFTVAGTHSITARATDNDGGQTTSAAVSIDVTTGIRNVNSSGLPFKVYPNPASDYITIDIAASSERRNISYKIVNMEGQVVMNRVVESIGLESVNISSLAKGLYTIVVSIDGNTSTQRIVKQ